MIMTIPFNTMSQSSMQSRAERTNYTETSRYEDVINFIGQLQHTSRQIKVEYFGVTNENRQLPLVILSKPQVHTPLEAAVSGKPIIFIMANIHAGEVEGKEATQHFMRDVLTGPLTGLLDKLILLVAPIYNADGNERIDINNRSAQNGPLSGVGVRENAQRLDLNRDFMKMETPEAHGLIEGVFNRWDPHVVVDLHTTNGSYHGYHLTYAPPLHPNTDARLISFLRGKLLPSVTKRLKTKHNYRAYYYGNFSDPQNPRNELGNERAGEPKAWATFDHRPRFGTNYVGLRNRLAILSEAYSYLDFRSRVDVTDQFIRAISEYVAAHATEVVELIRAVDRTSSDTGLTAGNESGYGIAFDLKKAAKPVEILVSSVTREVDPRNNRPRLQATDQYRAVKMEEWGEFSATRRLPAPSAYLLKPDQRKIIERLRAHGILVEQTQSEQTLEVEQYNVSEITKATRPFQGHQEARYQVTASTVREAFPAGSFVIQMNQSKAALIFYLLEPLSDDGLANWNFFDELLEAGVKNQTSPTFPVYRLLKSLRLPLIQLKASP